MVNLLWSQAGEGFSFIIKSDKTFAMLNIFMQQQKLPCQQGSFTLVNRIGLRAAASNKIVSMFVHHPPLEIRPVTESELDSVLEVYRQCEDFLALGPLPTASMEMVWKDLELSREQGGVFCGIFNANGSMIGVVDYVRGSFEGHPGHAFLSLLMIAARFRGQGIGDAVVTAVEAEIWKDERIIAILSGVQANNPRAVQFWQRHGYLIVGGPDRMPDQTTVFHLRKDLSKPA
jgi:ribosomal protein S18 acetylase RimI-like enzyme